MEALDALAVAERDILVRFAHSDSGPLRRPRAFGPRARLALPVRQDGSCVGGYRSFNVETALYSILSLAD